MATDDLGNIQVAYEWGNVPMQPNNQRGNEWKYLGAGGNHAINGVEWDNYPDTPNTAGPTLEGENALYWPSAGVCYMNNPKAPGNTWQDVMEYFRACGVNPSILREATFDGGDDKYDTGGQYAGGILFWDYIPANIIVYIDWSTGFVLTGKDFDGKVVAMNHPAGYESTLDNNDLEYSFVAFTNDPAKNTAQWWY